MAPLLEFEQERAAGHVFELPRRVAPVPPLAKNFGQSSPAPLGMLQQELPDEPQVIGTQLTALQDQVHEPQHARGQNRSPAVILKITGSDAIGLAGPLPNRESRVGVPLGAGIGC